MPELKSVYVHGKWRFRNKTYPSAQWHMVICQAELDVLLKYPDKFEVHYNAKGFPMKQKQSAHQPRRLDVENEGKRG